MNRHFTMKDVTARSLLETVPGLEEQQASYLNKLLGPKGAINEPYGTDFIIDLHSSNSNVGLVAMINHADKDIHALRLVNHLLNEHPEFSDLKIACSRLELGLKLGLE